MFQDDDAHWRNVYLSKYGNEVAFPPGLSSHDLSWKEMYLLREERYFYFPADQLLTHSNLVTAGCISLIEFEYKKLLGVSCTVRNTVRAWCELQDRALQQQQPHAMVMMMNQLPTAKQRVQIQFAIPHAVADFHAYLLRLAQFYCTRQSPDACANLFCNAISHAFSLRSLFTEGELLQFADLVVPTGNLSAWSCEKDLNTNVHRIRRNSINSGHTFFATSAASLQQSAAAASPAFTSSPILPRAPGSPRHNNFSPQMLLPRISATAFLSPPLYQAAASPPSEMSPEFPLFLPLALHRAFQSVFTAILSHTQQAKVIAQSSSHSNFNSKLQQPQLAQLRSRQQQQHLNQHQQLDDAANASAASATAGSFSHLATAQIYVQTARRIAEVVDDLSKAGSSYILGSMPPSLNQEALNKLVDTAAEVPDPEARRMGPDIGAAVLRTVKILEAVHPILCSAEERRLLAHIAGYITRRAESLHMQNPSHWSQFVASSLFSAVAGNASAYPSAIVPPLTVSSSPLDVLLSTSLVHRTLFFSCVVDPLLSLCSTPPKPLPPADQHDFEWCLMSVRSALRSCLVRGDIEHVERLLVLFDSGMSPAAATVAAGAEPAEPDFIAGAIAAALVSANRGRNIPRVCHVSASKMWARPAADQQHAAALEARGLFMSLCRAVVAAPPPPPPPPPPHAAKPATTTPREASLAAESNSVLAARRCGNPGLPPAAMAELLADVSRTKCLNAEWIGMLKQHLSAEGAAGVEELVAAVSAECAAPSISSTLSTFNTLNVTSHVSVLSGNTNANNNNNNNKSAGNTLVLPPPNSKSMLSEFRATLKKRYASIKKGVAP